MSGLGSSFNHSLPFLLASQAQKHVTFNQAIVSIDNLLMLAVKSRNLASSPTSPTEGDRYIISAPSSGEWAGKVGQIAAFNNLGWVFYPPKPGFICYVADENAVIFYDGLEWKPLSLTPDDFQNLAAIGIGTTADVNNPLSVKLNNALFAAKYISESGNGDIRIKLNKESQTKTSSFIFQDNWEGRAEFGLIGNDNFAIKVSADGANWRVPFYINNNNGRIGNIEISNNPNADSRPTISGTAVRIIGDDGMPIRLLLDGATTGVAIVGRVSTGTISSPHAVTDGLTMMSFQAVGTDEIGVSTNTAAGLFIRASQNWTNVGHGARLDFGVTCNNTTSRLDVLKLDNDGVLKPSIDNAYSLGSSTNRFSTLYCATGAINTSDARDKIIEGDISGASAISLIKAIEPKLYKWKIGKKIPDWSNHQPADNDKGNQPDFIDITGQRTHIGFLAQDVKSALDEHGLDLAVWGRDDKDDEESRQWLRPDQMIPILWAALREILASKEVN